MNDLFLDDLLGYFQCLRGLSHGRPMAKVISYQRSQNERGSKLRIKGLLGYLIINYLLVPLKFGVY